MTASQLDFGSQHTASFAEILKRYRLSLLVSTYQAGKLITLRYHNGGVNTHFQSYARPMGIAVGQHRIAIGGSHQIWQLKKVTAAAQSSASSPTPDAVYIPDRSQVTGDIDIHEMAYVNQELWFVNTQFSCLCTLDADHSFVPRWKPSFISAYALGDRCHLNGLGIRDGQVRYVTALGESDHPQGWRPLKAQGGVILDVQTPDPVSEGLSMPHSPRWYQGHLWFLESGYGSLARINPVTGQQEVMAQLPGFTRGLCFFEDLAFVGLSKVRETASFSGIPMTQHRTERICGIWIVQITTGTIVGYLKFHGAVAEIFAVELLPQTQYPDFMDWDSPLRVYVLPNAVLREVDRTVPALAAQVHEQYQNGNRCYVQGDLEGAIAAYRICLDLQPDFLPARYNLGVALGDDQRYSEAQAALEQVIQAEAAHACAHNSLGYIHVQLGNLEQARHHYRQAMMIRPDYDQAIQNLAAVQALIAQEPQPGIGHPGIIGLNQEKM
ncbi:TIGR03032 family protein [Lyngbya confervoides]|uniref:TIGR03032 family protein n=1 Tax=Lyngbya confervoides BDU141951 TaxID=1574623 RepID=A0ABD4SYE7_9CYAN|nr:TIGR03032 family protein [Lyngbya confervoides]MCM1981338.1 TIGR03032 family protein [Lyngbya confervoides BDU141951]